MRKASITSDFSAVSLKASFGAEKLMANLDTVLEAIAKAKPAAAKGQYFKSATIATTMGPGVRVATNKYGV